MAVVMDTCALRIAGAVGIDEFQAETTLAMCLSALKAIADTLRIAPLDRYSDRLPRDRFPALRERLTDWRLPAGDGDVWSRLSRIRRGYEPLLAAMATYFLIDLPEWMPASMIETPLEAAEHQ